MSADDDSSLWGYDRQTNDWSTISYNSKAHRAPVKAQQLLKSAQHHWGCLLRMSAALLYSECCSYAVTGQMVS